MYPFFFPAPGWSLLTATSPCPPLPSSPCLVNTGFCVFWRHRGYVYSNGDLDIIAISRSIYIDLGLWCILLFIARSLFLHPSLSLPLPLCVYVCIYVVIKIGCHNLCPKSSGVICPQQVNLIAKSGEWRLFPNLGRGKKRTVNLPDQSTGPCSLNRCAPLLDALVWSLPLLTHHFLGLSLISSCEKGVRSLSRRQVSPPSGEFFFLPSMRFLKKKFTLF